MRNRYSYPVELSEDTDGRLLAVFADIPGAATDGATRPEALSEAADCLEEALARCIDDGDAIPAPSPARGRPVVSPGALIAAKAALYEALGDANTTKSALARALDCDEAEVRRMLNPRHATKITRLERALAYLGRKLVVTVEAA